MVKSDDGLVRVLLNGQANASFTISYEGTTLAQVTVFISLITVSGLAIYIVKAKGWMKRKVY